jgi:7-carboxy-7-deazaguanine synthase
MMEYQLFRLNDIYPCVQGEGVLMGVAMVLVRLHGCPVGCPWCDTKETWVVDPQHYVATIDQALGANPRYTVVAPDVIAQYVREHFPGPRWILLTGGEPADQPLATLVRAFHEAGYLVALETSGTARGHIRAGCDWVCVSPKIGMPGGRPVLIDVLGTADEIKHVVGKQADIDALDRLLLGVTLKASVQLCLQPVSQSTKATELCLKTVQARGWRLSVQMHKYLAQR